MIDVGEALAHEAAQVGVDEAGAIHPERVTWEALPFRRLLRDPFYLASYPLMLSISTLTIRRSVSGTTFLLLRRDPAKVAIADFWRNVVREYSEEFLGNPEHDGDGAPVDYENEEPFRSLDAARGDGRVHVYCLGLGIDALNMVGDVFTVAVFDGDFFDRMFERAKSSASATTARSSPSTRRPSSDSSPRADSLPAAPRAFSSPGTVARRSWHHGKCGRRRDAKARRP